MQCHLVHWVLTCSSGILLQFDAVSESGSINIIQGHFSLKSNCTLEEKEFEAWRRDLSNRLQVLCPEMSPVADM